MANQEEIDELKKKLLCYRCIGEEYLRTEVQRQGRRQRCSYCNRLANAYTVGDLAVRIETAFQQHFRRTLNYPNSWQQSMLSDRESHYDWERDGEPVQQAIANAADIPEHAAEDIQAILEEDYSDFDSDAMGEETEYSSESYYAEKDTNDRAWQEEWSAFEKSLKTEARFFSRTAAAQLSSIFDGVESMSATHGQPPVINVGPASTLSTIYRARVFQSEENLLEALCRPDQHLGSPPTHLAAAGRMNAQGISVFYSANHSAAAIAEVRPPVGSQVAVARFNIVRPLRLLDLTALSTVREVGSIFDPDFANRLERAMFLRSLCQRITRPVMPDDEAFDYLITQAIADFLATENTPPLDGIVFPSVQAGGDALNVVLFHKAARVEALDIPEGTEINAHSGWMSDEGWEVDYSVREQVPLQRTSDTEQDGNPWALFTSGLWGDPDPDPREATLRIDLDSIKVHSVRRVEFDTVAHDVSRHRSERREPQS